MPSSPKLHRWIDLIAALLGHRFGISLDELARAVPAYARAKSLPALRRMFERDKDELRKLGVPIERLTRDGDEDARYTIRPTDFYLPYLVLNAPRTKGPATTPRRPGSADGYKALPTLAFDPDELAAVVDAVQRAHQLGDPELAADAESALRKLAFDLPVAGATLPRDTVYLLPRARASAGALADLGDALTRRKRTTFSYHAMSTGRSDRRSVEPYGLFFIGGHWYLVGHDLDRRALRNFRVNRIREIAVNPKNPGTPDYEIPADFDLRTHARSRQPWELGEGDVVTAIVEFLGDTGAVRASRALGGPVEGHERRRAFSVRRVDTFARWLLALGGDAWPLEPPELVREFQAQLADTLALYERRGA